MKCPKCHFDNPSDTRFCGNCAAPLLPSAESPVSQTETLRTPVKELATGSTFAGRYQVIEELGKGGMGKVYRVLDKKLREEVALKLIKPEIALDKETIERFSNELKLARKIGHRNVGRMYELMEDEGTHFITMEYVSGENLKSTIRRIGQLPVAKSMAIARQICEGLEEAHRLGIVHRDLKPSNIILDTEGNARIMDFGIARSLKAKALTGAGMIVGTPEYMSPEQVEGKDVDQRSDIYSLGIILYEMLTGRVPFEGDTPFTIGVKHKSEMPKSPRELNPQIPEELNHTILRCLEKDREKRYQSAADLRTDLENIEKGMPTTETFIPEKKGLTSREITVKFSLRKLFVPASIGLLALAVAMVIFFRSRGPHYDPKKIIVALFENQTGDRSHDPLGRIASDWITQGLSKAGIAEVVTAPPGETAPGTPKETERIRTLAREAGAGTLVSGAYFLQGKILSFHAQVSDLSKGKLIKALDPVSGPIEEPLKTIEVLRQKVIGALAGITDLRFRPFMDISGQPPTYEAYKEFAAAQEAFFRRDYKRAIELCLRAAELDSSFKTPVMMAAAAYRNLGQYAAVEKLIDELDKVRETLSPMDQLIFDWSKAVLQGDLAGRLRASRQLASRMNGMWIYQRGSDATMNNYPREAIKALSMLDPEGIWMKSWPAYWNSMTQAYHMLGRYKAELKQARRGRNQFPEIMISLDWEARALAALGRIEEIHKLIDQSLNLKPGRTYNSGTVMINAGQELRVHGFKKESLQLLDRAIQWIQAKPDEEKAKTDFREELADAYYGDEKWQESRILYEGLLKEDPENTDYLAMCGVLAARRGDREDALRISKQLEVVKKPYLWGSPTYHRACIASLLGEKESSVLLLREAISQGVSYWRLYADMDLDPLRDYPPFKELVRPKG